MFLNRFKVKYKLWMIVGLAMIGMTVMMLVASMYLRDSIMVEKKSQTEHLVDTAHSIVEYYYKLSKEKGMPEQEAKTAAMNTLRTMRYGEKEPREYFFITDMQARLLMHPIKPELDGKDMSDFKDPKGTKIFVEFAETVKKNKAGLVAYLWPKPNLKDPVEKISFVRGFEPWGWIVGTGIYVDDVQELYLTRLLQLSIPLAVMIVLIAILSWLIAVNITRPLSDITAKVEQIAGGDLTVTIDYASKDEIGALSQSADRMVHKFNDMINKILASSNNVVSTVDVLRTQSRKTAEGSRNQSGQASQIATAAEEMSQTITDIAKNASFAADTSGDAMEIASKGKDVVAESVATVSRVHTSTLELGETVGKLNNRVGEIGNIVTVIKDIADQTNLLALNAAIEAARAGEQGRGFAVVADEVRKLAERTIRATSEISSKIGAVQEDSAQTARSMQEASEEVTKATEYIQNVSSSLEAIVNAVLKVRDQITQIATSVEEQSAAAGEVTNNIEMTSGIAREMEDMSGQVMHEVNRLANIANELRDVTSGFRTSGSELMILELAKADHRLFVEKIASCLSGDTSLDPGQLPDHHTCRFGKWYDNEGVKTCGSLPSFKAVDAPHDRIHALAKEAVAACNAGNKIKADTIFKNIEDASEQIVRLLEGLKRECH
ncbi:MAG: chemotaxis protein [Thermodesulfovibrio sp.]|nr:chemotaxis protein [Thermodesulfovibrio sp.]